MSNSPIVIGWEIVGEYPPTEKGGVTYYKFIYNHPNWYRHGLRAQDCCHRHRSAGKDQNGVDIIKKEKNCNRYCYEF